MVPTDLYRLITRVLVLVGATGLAALVGVAVAHDHFQRTIVRIAFVAIVAGLLGLLVGLAISVLVACLRNAIANVIAAGTNLAAAPLRLVNQQVMIARNWCRRLAEHFLANLCYSPPNYEESAGRRQVPAMWDVAVPWVWASALLAAFAAESAVMYLRIAAMLGVVAGGDLKRMPVFGNVPLLLTIVWTSSGIVFGLMLFELIEASPLRQPYGKLAGRRRTVMLTVSILGISLTVAGAVLSLLWGQLVLMGHDVSALSFAFMAALGIVLAGSLACSGWSIPVCLGTVAIGVMLAGWVALAGIRLVLDLIRVVLDLVVTFEIGLIELLATPGFHVWSWVARSQVGGRLGFEPLEWEERPEIGFPFSLLGLDDELDEHVDRAQTRPVSREREGPDLNSAERDGEQLEAGRERMPAGASNRAGDGPARRAASPNGGPPDLSTTTPIERGW